MKHRLLCVFVPVFIGHLAGCSRNIALPSVVGEAAVEQLPEMAASLCPAAITASRQSPEVLYVVSHCYSFGWPGSPADKELALSYLRRSAECGGEKAAEALQRISEIPPAAKCVSGITFFPQTCSDCGYAQEWTGAGIAVLTPLYIAGGAAAAVALVASIPGICFLIGCF